MLARCQMRVGQTHQAIAAYGKIVSLQPRSVRGHLGLADVYLQTNELALAQRSIDRALELSPGLTEAQGQAIAVAVRRKQFDAALDVARNMQAQRPADAVGYAQEGEIEMLRGRWDAAVMVLRKALDKQAPGGAVLKFYLALVRGGATEAEQFAARWLKRHPRDIGFLFNLGDSAQVRGNNAVAEQRYQQILALLPDHVLALNNLAMLYIQLKKPGTTALAKRAVRNAPDQPALLDTLAQAHAYDNDFKQAIAVQQRAVALAHDEGTLLLSLARYQLQAGGNAQGRLQKSLVSSSPGR